MNKGPLGKILFCVMTFSMALCAYVHARNDVITLMIELPKISKELSYIEEQNTILQFEVEKCENPSYLLHLLKTTQYAHLLPSKDSTTLAVELSKKVIKQEDRIKGSSNTLLGQVR
jgi:hypothetical protein